MTESTQIDGIPMPSVTFNRSVLIVGIVAGLLLQQPLFTTLLFLLLLPAVLGGRRWSLIFRAGKRLFASKNAKARAAGHVEAPRLMRFNNSIALLLLGGAQIAFLAGMDLVGWLLALMVAVAAGVALAGFCLGCYLYFQFKLARYRFLT